MKRFNQLQPLSRQHHLGLNLSRHAKECANEPNEIKKHWDKLTAYMSSMSTHFQVEDNLIAKTLQPYRNSVPEVAKALDILDKQHFLLNELVNKTQSSQHKNISSKHVRNFGTLLYDHIRFEERELFPLVETYLTQNELDAIYEASSDSIKRLDEQR